MTVNREQFYAIMNGEGTLDYEVYLRTKALLAARPITLTCATKTSCSFRSCIRLKSFG